MKKQFAMLIIFFNLSCTVDASLLLIDTGMNDQYIYNDMLTMLQAGGLTTDYKQLHQVKIDNLDAYNALMIAIDPLFLSALLKKGNKQHPLVTSFKALMDQIKTMHNKTICFLLPPNNNKMAVTHYFNHLLQKTLAITHDKKQLANLAKFIAYLSDSDMNRSSNYDSALFDDQQKSPLTFLPIKHKDSSTMTSATLPFNSNEPLALYLFGETNNNHYFISKTSLLNCTGLKENFVYNPMNKKLREKKLKQIFTTLTMIAQTVQLNTLCQCFDMNQSLPYQFTHQYEKQQFTTAHDQIKLYGSAIKKLFKDDKIIMGWADLNTYRNKEHQAALTIIQSGINLLWFELNPECYLSKRGVSKNKQRECLALISRFTQALMQEARKQGKKPPYMVMGTDITTNFRKTPVHIPARDIFGRTYSKIPAPLDFEQFWLPELIEVFDSFVNHWHTIGNGIPLAGIFLDLEMYHAQDQTAQYNNFMDFSDNALNAYSQSNNNPTPHHTDAFIRHLIDNDKLKDYYTVLQHHAYLLGKKIRSYIKQKMPDALIGVYNIAPPNNWFYKGFLAGLGTKNDPIVLATFNFNFYKHYPWFAKHNIYAFHLPVLLLSKIKTTHDFQKIKPLAATNDGIWLNKISRLEESRNPKEWSYDFRVEVTPLPTKTFTKHLEATIKSLQTN